MSDCGCTSGSKALTRISHEHCVNFLKLFSLIQLAIRSI